MRTWVTLNIIRNNIIVSSLRARGGCLGVIRIRAWKAAISLGELPNERRSRNTRARIAGTKTAGWRQLPTSVWRVLATAKIHPGAGRPPAGGQFHQVKRMIRGRGAGTAFASSQTLNWWEMRLSRWKRIANASVQTHVIVKRLTEIVEVTPLYILVLFIRNTVSIYQHSKTFLKGINLRRYR
jgi:hypothetical protein